MNRSTRPTPPKQSSRRTPLLPILFLAAASAAPHASAQHQPIPPSAPAETTFIPKPTGPNTSNLMPPARVKFTTTTRNPVVRTHAFPIGINFGTDSAPSYLSPYLLHTGRGHWVQYGYPYPLDLSFHNLQPGQTVTLAAPTWWTTQYEGYPLTETRRRVDPAVAALPAQPAPQPQTISVPADEGRVALRARDYTRAIAIYERRHDEQLSLERAAATPPPADRTALRMLAIALAGAGRMNDAAETLAQAQAEDAALSALPIPGDELFANRQELRRLVLESLKHAKASPSRESWELVAVLMEAEGRKDVAARMRERGLQPPPPPRRPSPPGKRPASYRMPAPPAP